MLPLKVGDKATRMLAGTIPCEVTVVKIDEELIYCGTDDGPFGPIGMDTDNFNGWTFDREDGYEIDEEIGWGVKGEDGKIVTGSYLTLGASPSEEVEKRTLSSVEVFTEKIEQVAKGREKN